MTHVIDDILSLADWRQQIACLYQKVASCQTLADIWPEFVSERRRLYASHTQSPIQTEANMAFFEYNPNLCFEASLIPLMKTDTLTVDGGKDGRIDFTAIATTRGLSADLGRELTLYQMTHYGGGLFLPFCDKTNGSSTYGGGRYLIDTAKSAWLGMTNDKIRLDFNFAYFPSCAHDARYICPLSPPANLLEVPVRAGERWA